MELGRGCVVGVLTALWERSLSLCSPISLFNLSICLSLTLICLDSFTLLMKLVHLSIVEGVTKDANFDLHLSSLSELSWWMLLIALTLSWSNSLTTLCMTCLALLNFIVDLGLTLTGTISLLRHLSVNLWWFLQSLSLICKLSISYSKYRDSCFSSIQLCRFLILV